MPVDVLSEIEIERPLREVAVFAADPGARADLFTAAMSGQLAVVKAVCEARPGVQSIRGLGGERATAVVEYLERLRGADPPLDAVVLTPAQRSRYVGRYRFAEGADDVLELSEVNGALRIQRAPAGAEAVRIRFEGAGPKAAAITVHDPDLLVRGIRLI